MKVSSREEAHPRIPAPRFLSRPPERSRRNAQSHISTYRRDFPLKTHNVHSRKNNHTSSPRIIARKPSLFLIADQGQLSGGWVGNRHNDKPKKKFKKKLLKRWKRNASHILDSPASSKHGKSPNNTKENEKLNATIPMTGRMRRNFARILNILQCAPPARVASAAYWNENHDTTPNGILCQQTSQDICIRLGLARLSRTRRKPPAKRRPDD
jgi:hypothetical protein